MDKHAAQRLLRGNGTGFPTAEWLVLRSVLTAESDPALPTLAEHAERDSQRVVEVVVGNGLCSWALHACPSLKAAPEAVHTTLTQGAQCELGACAQRKWALLALDRLAAEHGCQPVVIKGAANALVYYDKESLRPSRDIDIVLEPGAMVRCFGASSNIQADPMESHEWGEAAKFQVAGYAVEAHGFLISPRYWGGYHDLAEDSQVIPGFTALRHPNATAAFTIALLHFAHHCGQFPFDLLDMMRLCPIDKACPDTAMSRVPGARCMAFWQDKGLVNLIMPGLTVLDALTPVISSEDWRVLFDGLTPRRRREVLVSLRFLSFQRLSKLRWEWFNSRFAPPSFTRRVLGLFGGSKALTQQRTGLSPKHPLFWFFHLVGLPLKRILFGWK